jgi:2-polyprenyl-6-methoxyphenol hydroxylase-like FAD-dependent oxidoreductase
VRYLVSQNLKTPGFQFFDNERVVDIKYDGRFRVHTAKQTLVGRQLVGADGAYSIVNRVFSIGTMTGAPVASAARRSFRRVRLCRSRCWSWFGYLTGRYMPTRTFVILPRFEPIGPTARRHLRR